MQDKNVSLKFVWCDCTYVGVSVSTGLGKNSF